LQQALDALVDPATRGHPESPLRWTCKTGSTHLQHCLQQALWPGSHYPNHNATAWS
jgi:hypothetical protein